MHAYDLFMSHFVVNGTCHNCLDTCPGGRCDACKPGYYGDNCEKFCEHCNNSCHRNGSCTDGCNDGFYRVLSGQCKSCPRKCFTCTNEQNCTICHSGYTGTVCSDSCPRCKKNCPDLCQDGLCTYSHGHVTCNSCANTTYDSDCKPCPIGCSSCQEPDAYCTSCQAGFSGDQCLDTCPEGCKDMVPGVKCRTENNNQIICKNGCNPLYYGPDCKPCGLNCSVCDNQSGICSQCKHGFYDTSCSSTCPKSCGIDNKCSVENSGSLICAYGCDQGHHGDGCSELCSANCGNKTCKQQDGHCFSCVDGYYGDKCNQNCTHCSFNNVCIQYNGTCVHGCEYGYHGSKCNLRCPQKCSSEGCNRSTGDCVSCEAAFFGNKCQYNCSVHCVGDRSCAFGNGTCVHGCETGYLAPNCTIREYSFLIMRLSYVLSLCCRNIVYMYTGIISPRFIFALFALWLD